MLKIFFLRFDPGIPPDAQVHKQHNGGRGYLPLDNLYFQEQARVNFIFYYNYFCLSVVILCSILKSFVQWVAPLCLKCFLYTSPTELLTIVYLCLYFFFNIVIWIILCIIIDCSNSKFSLLVESNCEVLCYKRSCIPAFRVLAGNILRRNGIYHRIFQGIIWVFIENGVSVIV